MENRKSLVGAILFLSLILPLQVNAKMGEFQGNTVMPVEWQAIKLQENIEDKIKRSLNPLIKENDYVIEVKIGFDLDKAEDPSSKKVTKTIQRKKVQFSNTPLPKDGDDFVVFNKLGLEAPVVGDEPVESTTSEIELAQKAMIEMNDRFNLFNYLNTIDIKLTFDKSLPEKSKLNIKKIVEGLSFNTKDVLPQINIQYLDLKDPKVMNDQKADAAAMKGKADNEKNSTSFGERFKNLDIMLGLIISAIIFGLVALYIAHKGSKVEEKQEAKNENVNEGTSDDSVEEVIAEEVPPTEDEEILLEGEDMILDLTKTDMQTMRINEGLERFRKVMIHHHSETILLVKGWIQVGKGLEAQALKGLVQLLVDQELADIFKSLTIDERSSWKMCLDGELNKEEMSKAFIYISNSIIQMMMVPSLIDDYEICDMLLILSADDASKFCIQHPELGVVFTNVLSSKVISEMFKVMPLEVSADIIERSTLFKKEEILGLMPLLKETLIKVKDKRERPPFLKRIVEILPTARPEIEKKLYGTLLKHLPVEDVCESAINIFPMELVNGLPDTIYREIVALMSIEQQVLYFVSMGDNRYEQLDRIASKGSKSREMIEFEVNATLKNEMATRRIMIDKKSNIEMEFLKSVRNYISTHPESQKEVYPVMTRWLEEIKSESDDQVLPSLAA